MFPSSPRPRWALPGSSLAVLILAMAGAPARAQESWDAVYLGGSKIGYIHTFVQKVPDHGVDYLRVRIDIEQRLKRRDDETVIRLRYGTIETLDGEVLKLDTRTEAGQTQDIRVHGDVIKHQMKLVIDAGGQRQQRVIPWGPDVHGPYGAEQSMARKPMKEHEKRPLKMYIPELNKVCDVLLESRTYEPILLGDGAKRPLLRIDQATTVDGKRRPEYDARLYVDKDGQVLKSEQDVLGGMVVYRTTEEAARAPAGPIKFDLILSTVLKVDRKIASPDQTRHIKYRLTLKGSEPAKVFPADARQSIQAQESDPNSAILEIKSSGPLDGEAAGGEVAAEFRTPNALIDSDDVRVRSLATRVTRGVIDPWAKATAINQWVHQNIKDKDFSTAFAAAGEVARNLKGDCTEHAVLAAAMCRAVAIPSRVVVGLLYVDDLGGFGFHMWDEVYVNNRWVAIDPAWGQATVDAVHIKLSDSSLDGVAPFETFLPVIAVSGRLSIEPIEIR
jgi:Transglutaminase-like superfamily